MRAGIYGRQSRDKTASIDQQEHEARDLCGRESWSVTHTYRDGSSASRFATKARSDWQRLLADIRGGKLDVLVLWESSRGDRELESWAGFLNACRRHTVLIHVLTHHRTYDLTRARDWRTLAEDGVDSAYESEKTSERILRSVRAMALEGRPHGRPLYGYDRVYNPQSGALMEVVINEDQASVIREAARRVLAGETTYLVASDFNSRGIPTPRAGRWTAMGLNRVLQAPWERDGSELDLALRDAEVRIRSGEAPSAVSQDFRDRDIPAPGTSWGPIQLKRLLINPSYNGKRTHRGKTVGDAMWPPILDAVTFHTVRAKLTDPARGRRRDSAAKHLLTGIARCGWTGCGAGLTVLPNRGSKSYMCFKCYRVARVERKVDGVVEEAIVGFLSRPDAADLLALLGDSDSEVEAALAEATKKRALLDGFYDEAAAGGITPAGLARIESKLIREIDAADRRARRMTVKPVVEQALGPDAEERWGQLVMSQKREIIAALMTVRVLPVGKGRRTFDPSMIEIRWRWEAAAS